MNSSKHIYKAKKYKLKILRNHRHEEITVKLRTGRKKAKNKY